MQQRQIRTMCEGILSKEEIAEACKVVECEIDGQNMYYAEHKEFVSDQRAFTKAWMKLVA